jgi:hypothetical protein
MNQMHIDINQFTEIELIDLNRRIVERLRFLAQAYAHRKMLEFKIGDRVTFQSDQREVIEGMLTRYNKKTVTILTDQGKQWNVSPSLLRAKPSVESESQFACLDSRIGAIDQLRLKVSTARRPTVGSSVKKPSMPAFR